MCGINGYINFNDPIQDDKVIRKMNLAIKHRGPDGDGSLLHKKTALGHVRLSIIDLNRSANQPMLSNDGRLVLSFNGEIYNYKALKKELKEYPFKTNSDSEVILAAYQKWGKDCLCELNGMFSFVIYDKDSQTLFGARDPFGVKPFYYCKTNEFFAFSSEIKGLLSINKISPKLNEGVFYDFIAFNRTDHLEESCFKGVNNLRPGHCFKLNVEKNEIKFKKWYSGSSYDLSNKSYGEIKNSLKKKLIIATKLHLVSDVEVGSALSGGIDSSSIVGLIRSIEENKRINVFSAVYDQSWEKDEKIYIDKVVKEKNLDANFVRPNAEGLLMDLESLIYQQEEPVSTASVFAAWSVCKEAKSNKIKVLLNGQGADEIFGYDYMAAYYFKELLYSFKWWGLFREIYFFIKKQSSVNFTLKLFVFLLMPKIVKNRLLRFSNSIINIDFFQKYNAESKFNSEFFNVKNLNASARKHLEMKLHHLLRFEDKSSMMFGVETRIPFLEKDLVDFVLNIPSKFKILDGSIKHVLKDAAKGFIPKMIYDRNNKIGYETPMAKWMRSDSFKKEIEKMLESSNQPMKKYLNLSFIKKIWKKHLLNKGDFSSEIWKYFYLTKWYNIYFKP